MSKQELIQEIRRHNRTVSPEFLARFGEEDLQAYLARVDETREMTPERIRATVEADETLIVA